MRAETIDLFTDAPRSARSNPKRRRRSPPGDSALRPLILKMANAYTAKYGMPLVIAWGRDMKQVKQKVALIAPFAEAVGADPHHLVCEAYEIFLEVPEQFYQRSRHDTRLFWRDAQRFLGEAADRRRRLAATPDHLRPNHAYRHILGG
jgi:hypothetical protein